MPKGENRRPPLPHWRIGVGFCRWCGKETPPGKRGRKLHWHPECLHLYWVATSSRTQRQVCWDRDRGQCSHCKTHTATDSERGSRYFYSRAWQADHIKPLFEANGDLSYWGEENLQTLCLACHKAKSARDIKRLPYSRGKVRENHPDQMPLL